LLDYFQKAIGKILYYQPGVRGV